jgi:hypothetical protein
MIQIVFKEIQEDVETQEDNPKLVDVHAKDSNIFLCIFFYHIKTSITATMICSN